MKWMGRLIIKIPLDLWVFQEIIHETKPTVIIEIGNARGGSTLFLANLLDIIKNGKVVAIDIDHRWVKDLNHPRIKWITGDVTNMEVFRKVQKEIKKDDRVMIIEDSSHMYDKTLSILNLYSSLVSVGCYFIVEDSYFTYDFVDGPKPGPYESIHTFLKKHNEFEIDKNREKFQISYNPDGYLKKIR